MVQSTFLQAIGVREFAPHEQHLHLALGVVHDFDARGIAKPLRHAAIFGALDALQPGETMRFVNDHEPLPLLRAIAEHYGREVAFEYRQFAPDRVVIDFIKCPG